MQDFLAEMAKVLGRPVHVSLDYGANGSGEYAYTDGKKAQVVIDPWKLTTWDTPVRAWLQTKGLFYHELMHCVADPVSDYGAVPPNLRRTVNALSDQTGECRFVNMYPGARSYFAMNVFEIILKGNVNERTYALVYGRRSFLPARLVAAARKLMREQFKEREVAEIERLIDQYHVETTRGAPVKVFAGIAESVQRILQREMKGMDEQVESGRLTNEAQRSDANQPQPSQPSGGEGQGEGEGEEGVAESGDEQGEGGKGKAAGEAESDESSDGSGSGPGEHKDQPKGKPGKPKSVADEMKDIVAEEQEQAESGELATAEREVGEMALGAEIADSTEQASVALAALLKRVQMKATAGYEGGFKSGRLDLRAVMQERARPVMARRGEVFRQFTPDRQKDTKLSVAILIDFSGSMSGSKLADVNQAAAAVAMACERSSPVLNRVMIRYFDDTDSMTKGPNDRFDPKTSLSGRGGGGTAPVRSITRALDWLERESGVRVMLILTDGEWNDSVFEHRALADRARKVGVGAQVYYLDFNGRRTPFPTKKVSMGQLADEVFGVVNEALRLQAGRVV